MTDPGAPRHGRHASADDRAGGAVPRSGWTAGSRGSAAHRYGVLDHDATGPLLGGPPAVDPLTHVATARHAADDAERGDETSLSGPVDWPADGYVPEPGRHPSAPLPPRPPGVWDRLHRRAGTGAPDEDAPTEAHPLPADAAPGRPLAGHEPHDEAATDAHPLEWQESTGGLEVIGHAVEERPSRRARRAQRREAAHGPLHDALHEDHDLEGTEEELALHASDRRAGRRRRRPLAVALLLLLLVGVVAGVLAGGQKLLGVLNPAAEDFGGAGTGAVEIRVEEGDTLSDIGATLVDAGVIASVEPFVEAAEGNEAATGIQPGVYTLREEMSGQAALDLLLDPAARMVSKVTVPEGLTVDETLQSLAEQTGTPIEQFEAAAADPAALGLPEYSGGTLEGFLFPATYDFEPGTTPADMLGAMVDQYNHVTAEMRLEQRAAAAGRTPAEIVVVASMIEAETLVDQERPDVAQVIYNRLAEGIPLGIDATLAYGLDKNGNDLTVTDLETDSRYNTRTRTGLPPTPISAPGQASLEAALEPTTGTLLYYVLESEDGSHFFTDDYAEFQEARQRCAAAGLGCGG